MKIPHSYTDDNLKVLGIVIRSKRIEKGYSLRDLGDITNISHTLISNIEKGKQIPNKDSLSEIMRALDLEYNDDPIMLKEMRELRSRMVTLLMYQEYEQAKVVLNKLMEQEELYLHSPQVVNYIILKYLYIAMTNTPDTDIDDALEHYSKVVEFFGDIQTQMFHLIVGLNHLNNERYNRASETFEQALKIGDKQYDAFVKEYLVITMVRGFRQILRL